MQRSPKSVPIATYRLQLHAGFGFDDASAIAGYLSKLGISHVYCSPYLQSAPGSTHGYDVMDHANVNVELGGEGGHARFCAALSSAGLKQVLDIVPNHMSIQSIGNVWWRDVLENGPSSAFAAYFDIEWQPADDRMKNNLLLPILRDHYGRELEAGHFCVKRQGRQFMLHYFDQVLPLAPRSLAEILAGALRSTGSPELAFLADAYGALPSPTATDRRSTKLRHRNKEVLGNLLLRLLETNEIANAVDAALAQINGDPNLLDPLIEHQNYRLAHWRVAQENLGYRRFFDVNSLIGLRADDDEVFEATHARILQWVRDGLVDGLRVDHPDGLADPEAYFERLNKAAPGIWIVPEKILGWDEELPSAWQVSGTTGYDFLALVGDLLAVDGLSMLEIYHTFTGETSDFRSISIASRLQVLDEVLGSDIDRLSELFAGVCERRRCHRDYVRRDLARALREVIAHMPVYRTYVRPETKQVSEQDKAYVHAAVRAASARCTDLEPSLFELIASVLLLESEPVETEFVKRFQQLTGPAMAKGVEDTAFYRYHCLVSLNEVGGAPDRQTCSLRTFHHACTQAQQDWPLRMTATSTHDTKRSEDVRARLHVLSEIPAQWAAAVSLWTAMNHTYWGDETPDRAAEYLLYQTLVGAWPIDESRVQAYMNKAVREAKLHTKWLDPNEHYEATVSSFVSGVLGNAAFVRQLACFSEEIALAGRVKSLSQVLLKLTAPGIPDFYQGTEIWEHSLVDPDNRRPVDYAARLTLLESLDGMTLADVMAGMDSGLPKLLLTREGLRVRREHPEAFGPDGAYTPLAASGARSGDVIAYMRGDSVCAIAPRATANPVWDDCSIALPEGDWRHQLSGEQFEGFVPLTKLWRDFPVALLVHLH